MVTENELADLNKAILDDAFDRALLTSRAVREGLAEPTFPIPGARVVQWFRAYDKKIGGSK